MDAQSSPSAKIFPLVKFHATLATLLLALTTAFTPIPQTSASPSQHHHHHHHHHVALTNTLAYLHLWCATLGFIWWYAANATTIGDPGPDNEQQQQQRREEQQRWVQTG